MMTIVKVKHFAAEQIISPIPNTTIQEYLRKYIPIME